MGSGPQVSAKVTALREQVARFRIRALELQTKLIEIEPGNEEVTELRERLMASVVRIENVIRELLDPPYPPVPRRRPKGTAP